MNIRFLFFLLIIWTYTIFCQQNQGQAPIFNVTISPANTIVLDQNTNTKVSTDHTSSHISSVNTQIKQTPEEKLYSKLQDFYDQQTKNYNNIYDWLQNNKLIVTGATLLSVYSYINYQIYQANLIINNPNSWSNWHNSTTLEALFNTPQHKLESDLLFTIQARYVHPTNPTDFIYPLVQSSNSLQEEIAILQQQITRYEWIKTCRSLHLFFINEQELEMLKEKQRKLLFIQHLFASWCAAYKIDKNS